MNEKIIQGTDEWYKIRLGKASASRVSDVVARTKSGWGASRANYMAQLIAERLTGEPQERVLNTPAIQWGTDTEPQARAAYSFFSGHEVVEVGFVEHPTIKMAGASPDGLVCDDGLLEIKSPNTATHIETLLGDHIDKKYMLQMMWQMACTGRKWCDFVSFDPRLPLDLQMKVIRVNRDDKLIQELENDVALFLGEVEQKVEALNKLVGNQDDVGKLIMAG